MVRKNGEEEWGMNVFSFSWESRYTGTLGKEGMMAELGPALHQPV